MRWNEIVKEAMAEPGGWWITDKGEFIDCDHDNDRHHSDIAANYFSTDDDEEEEYDDDYVGDDDHDMETAMADSEAAIMTALDAGWVRGSSYSDHMGIEWHHLTHEAKKALLGWTRSYGPAYHHLVLVGGQNPHQTFDDARKAISFIRSF